MNRQLVCNNCGHSNPVYGLNCTKCNSFLRSRVPNIDLWDTIWNLLVSPNETAIRLIQAEKKNFVVFLLSLWFIKASINYYIISNYFDPTTAIAAALIKGGILSVLLVFSVALLCIVFMKSSGLNARYKDILTLYTYSLTPILLAFVFLTPFHVALYGFYWYTINPSPLIIKPLVSYILYGIEGLFYLWVLLLFISTTFVQLGNKKITAAILGMLLFLIVVGYQILIV